MYIVQVVKYTSQPILSAYLLGQQSIELTPKRTSGPTVTHCTFLNAWRHGRHPQPMYHLCIVHAHPQSSIKRWAPSTFRPRLGERRPKTALPQGTKAWRECEECAMFKPEDIHTAEGSMEAVAQRQQAAVSGLSSASNTIYATILNKYSDLFF